MKTRFLPIVLLIIYIAILIKVMVFKAIPLIHVGQLMLNFGGANAGSAPNFVPFKTIVPYLFGAKGLLIGGINLAGNIILLVPLGFLVMLVARNTSCNLNWKKMLGIAVASGLIIEVMQVLLRVGIFDIDDVILNAVGFMIGYGIFVQLQKWLLSKKYTQIVIAAVLILTAITGAFYFIYPRNQPVNPNGSAGAGLIESDAAKGDAAAGTNLCGATNGTGEIAAIGKTSISLKLNDDSIQKIGIGKKTEIKNPNGPITLADLKVGDRVTIVITNDVTAEAILVCGNN
ncbi:MAG: VanZ family protein [Candidatus Pacebacteria bacterium]|nr:VanZ family protein [Candidatus Paceibacterota bacterium]